MKEPISVLLERVSNLRTKQQKVDELRAYSSTPLMIILQYAFHPSVKWLLPEGKVPYKPTKNWDDQEGHLYHEARKLYLFIEGGYPGNISQAKREELFVQLLESVDPRDAAFLVVIKDKKFPYDGLNAEIVREAFPGLLP